MSNKFITKLENKDLKIKKLKTNIGILNSVMIVQLNLLKFLKKVKILQYGIES